jgi:hypothetical protein
VLSNVDPASLKSTPAHLSIESKVTEAMMFGRASISVEHQVFQVVANGNSVGAVKSPTPVGKRVGKAQDM